MFRSIFFWLMVFLSVLSFSSVYGQPLEEPEQEKVFQLQEMNIDAERAACQSMISRPQDEISKETIELKPGKTPGTRTLDTAGKAAAYPEVEASTCFDLGFRQQFTKDFAFYMNVENVTDDDNIVLIQGSDTKNKAGLLMDPIYYRNGRRTTAGVEVKF